MRAGEPRSSSLPQLVAEIVVAFALVITGNLLARYRARELPATTTRIASIVSADAWVLSDDLTTGRWGDYR
jgi:hypothetical protein